MNLTVEERVEVLQLLNANSSRMTAQLFNQRHPNRIRPLSHATVARIYQKFIETGSVEDKARAGRPRNQNIEAAVLEFVQVNPRASVRRMALATNHSTKTVSNVLHRNGFHPYKAQIHQAIFDDDDEQRMFFCTVLTDRLNADPGMAQNILWTDESLFRLNGTFNRQNNRYNP